jgi:hypothetical protein
MKLNLNKGIKIICLMAFAFGMVSCSKDKGNYDYQPKNAITIGGIDSTYTIMAGETFIVSPKVMFLDGSDAKDTSQFTYTWKKQALDGGVTDLSDKQELSIRIAADKFSLNQENTIYFVVIDKKTAARVQFRLRLNVTTETSFTKKGWYVLSEADGGSRLSLISYTSSPYTYYKDVLKTIGSSLTLNDKGRPFSLAIDHILHLTVSTEKTSVYLPVLNGLDWKTDFTVLNQFIAAPPANTVIEYAGPLDVQTKDANTVFANNNYYIESTQHEDLYGTPINQYNNVGTTFKASPFFGAFWQERGVLMFDMDKRQFVLYRLNVNPVPASPVLRLPVEGGSTVDLPVNKDLRHMAKVRYTGERGQVFAIMKDASNKYSLLRFEGRTTARTTIVLKAAEAEITATDFDKAEHITFHPVYGYIYYNVGSKIYAYDPIGTKTSKLMLDVGSDKISLLEFSISNNRAFLANPEELSRLAVGTYNSGLPDGENGKLSFYNIPSAMGAITPIGNSYSGFGIIKSIAFVVQ